MLKVGALAAGQTGVVETPTCSAAKRLAKPTILDWDRNLRPRGGRGQDDGSREDLLAPAQDRRGGRGGGVRRHVFEEPMVDVQMPGKPGSATRASPRTG